MAQHGYLHDEYDREFGADENRWRDSGEDRNLMFDRSERERGWRGRDRDRWSTGSRDDDRGFFGRLGDETRSWLRDDDASNDRSRWQGRSDADEWFGGRSQSARGMAGRERGSQQISSNRDDHYRSWREKQMQALDRDYADYCREREQQFHSEFDAWRSQRRGNQEPLLTGMTQTAQRGDLTGEAEHSGETGGTLDLSDPMASATAGTNTSEMTGAGKTRRS